MQTEGVGMTGTETRHRWRWVTLAALLTAEAMNLLDATIVQVAAPTMHTALGGPAADMQWFGAAYTLPFALLLITGGRLGDIAGRKRVFLIGVVGFVPPPRLCTGPDGAGPDRVAGRAGRGRGAGHPADVRADHAPRSTAPELPKALGTIGPVMGLAAICGPLLGALLTHADIVGSSWRAVFLVNIPLVVGVLACGPALHEDAADVRPRLDLGRDRRGEVGFGLVVVPLIEGGTRGPGWTWASARRRRGDARRVRRAPAPPPAAGARR